MSEENLGTRKISSAPRGELQIKKHVAVGKVDRSIHSSVNHAILLVPSLSYEHDLLDNATDVSMHESVLASSDIILQAPHKIHTSCPDKITKGELQVGPELAATELSCLHSDFTSRSFRVENSPAPVL